MTPTIGIPMTALGSVPVITLITSPQRFTTNMITASQYPQRLRSHKPIVVKVQAIQTAIISTMAHEPIRLNPARALGLRRQIGSRKLPEKVRDTAERKLAHVPIANSTIKAITPKGRALVMHLTHSDCLQPRCGCCQSAGSSVTLPLPFLISNLKLSVLS